MKVRILILPASALIIAALVTWRLHREPQQRKPADAQAVSRQLAPRFELYDQHSQLVKFERYLGRTRLLVLFFDGQSPPDQNPLLARLRDHYAAHQAAGFEVVAISSATPFAIREDEQQSGREFPFPVLTDIDMRSPIPVPVHRKWGLADEKTTQTRTGLFLVNRDGSVPFRNGVPVPIENPEKFVDRLLQTAP